MNCELWITIHSVLIALVSGVCLYSETQQAKREAFILRWLSSLSKQILALRQENDKLKLKIEKAELKKKGKDG